jgi:putative inorganic carbon (HCO3(-)) transporter
MRDLLVLAIILSSAPACLFSPYYGILVWTWIAYFNPHRFTYGVAYAFPVAITIAVPTIVGAIFTRNRNHRVLTLEFTLLLAVWLWFGVTTFYAMNNPILAEHAVDARVGFVEVSKVLVMTIMSILLITSQQRFRALLIVTALSFGGLALKGALFGASTGGQFRFYGPPDSFIEDNNMMALAMNMTLPMMLFLARGETRRWLRRLLWLSFFCGIVAVLLSYSRGGVLALTVSLGMIAIKMKKKILGAVLIAGLGFLVLTFAPDTWMNRMSNFFHGNLDESAELRLNAWQFALALAAEYPLTGGGFNTFTPQLYDRFTPGLRFAGPHSIYFQLIGEQGYVGLGLFLLLVVSIWFSAGHLGRLARKQPSLAWMGDYASMIQPGIAAYLVGGAFLARAYFDLFYLFVASVIIMKILYRRELVAHSQVKDSAFVSSPLEETAVSA